MSRRYIFSSESVSEGHPDKVCDAISDAVLDACIGHDRHSRVACETFAKSNMVFVGGEITIPSLSEDEPLANVLPVEQLVRDTVRDIGYVNDDDVFHADKIFITNIITKQSPDIAQGVDARAVEGKDTAEQGAGDQGLMFGYACDETPELMPLPIMMAHKLVQRLSTARREGVLNFLRPDGKSQVSVEYVGNTPKRIEAVVISTQHSPEVSTEELRAQVKKHIIDPIVPSDMVDSQTKYHINATGRFVVGGPHGDTGLTGRKIIVDTYGGMGRHGGGAFSGKDPTKVDRSACYMARYIAKNLVAAKLATRVEVQLAYAIGVAEPVSGMENSFGSVTVTEG